MVFGPKSNRTNNRLTLQPPQTNSRRVGYPFLAWVGVQLGPTFKFHRILDGILWILTPGHLSTHNSSSGTFSRILLRLDLAESIPWSSSGAFSRILLRLDLAESIPWAGVVSVCKRQRRNFPPQGVRRTRKLTPVHITLGGTLFPAVRPWDSIRSKRARPPRSYKHRPRPRLTEPRQGSTLANDEATTPNEHRQDIQPDRAIPPSNKPSETSEKRPMQPDRAYSKGGTSIQPGQPSY
jgi:hypothetical protein